MEIHKESFGTTPEGVEVDRYTLVNNRGARVAIITYGATITSVEIPDRRGNVENVVLSLESLQDYLDGHPYFGSTIGRFANRIAKGRFSIQSKEYCLATNNGPNHLHGGTKGFDKVVWSAESVETADAVGVVFSHHSPDGHEGYPGNLNVKATYTLTSDNELRMEYAAETDRPTIVNLTNHAYWNLAAASTDVLGHQLMLNADLYLPIDSGLIPLGELKAVRGTPMDFNAPQTLGSRIAEVEGGYDHCYVLNRSEQDEGPTLAARVVDPQSGRAMEVYTTQPGIQLYSGNVLDGALRRSETAFQKHFALCLETQHFPDSPNQPEFPSTLLEPGEEYRHTTVHRFDIA